MRLPCLSSIFCFLCWRSSSGWETPSSASWRPAYRVRTLVDRLPHYDARRRAGCLAPSPGGHEASAVADRAWPARHVSLPRARLLCGRLHLGHEHGDLAIARAAADDDTDRRFRPRKTRKPCHVRWSYLACRIFVVLGRGDPSRLPSQGVGRGDAIMLVAVLAYAA